MDVRKAYLLAYNTTQLTLWSLSLISLAISLAQFGESCEAYRAAAVWARRGQALAWAEVLHAAAGLAGGGAAAAFVQTAGRSAVLFAVLDHVVQTPCGLAAALVATWGLADVPRYAFYIATLVERTPGWLLWVRYSFFLVLYPIGFGAEWLIYFATLAEVDRTGLHAVTLPNRWNFAFDFGVWNRAVLVSYLYFAPTMFLYMLRQRRKKLGLVEPHGD